MTGCACISCIPPATQSPEGRDGGASNFGLRLRLLVAHLQQVAVGGNSADRALAGIDLLAIARGNRRRESVLSNQHRLLGENTRHRALRRCQGDRGQEGRGEVAGGVDAGHAGFAALVDLEGDADGRIDRGEAQ
jgi:hypothetical protein